MSMHEINTAAETITAAADPDANIIFGATINPDLEGEMIITVVATGFDASYFAERTAAADNDLLRPAVTPKADENLMKDMDLDMDDKSSQEDEFHADKPMPNIWAMDNDTENAPPEEADKAKNKDTPKADENEKPQVFGPNLADDDDELEKPSFLRRLTRHKKETKKEADSSSQGDKKE